MKRLARRIRLAFQRGKEQDERGRRIEADRRALIERLDVYKQREVDRERRLRG